MNIDAMIREYQQDRGLQTDGRVGSATWRAVMADLTALDANKSALKSAKSRNRDLRAQLAEQPVLPQWPFAVLLGVVGVAIGAWVL